MSQGLSFLRACIAAGAQQEFRSALSIWFTEDELRAYTFVAQHVARYGQLPSLQSIAEEGLVLPNAPEPPAFYAGRLRDRSIIQQVQTYHPYLLDGMKRMSAEEIVGAIRALMTSTNQVAPMMGMSSFADQSQLVLDYHDMARHRHGLIGTTLGWECLDIVTDGAQPGDVVVLAGRPGIGKTYMLLHIMRQAWLSGSSIFIASMEMPAMQIARRLLGMHAGVNPNLLRSGRLSSQAYGTVVASINDMNDMPPIHIMTGNFKKRMSEVDQAVQELSPDCVYIDAGYLLSPEKRANNRREAIADVITEVKESAMNRNRPYVITVQLNRNQKRKGRATPEIESIAGSDDFAQIGSIVVGARFGNVPYERSTRILSVIKNREGDEIEFEINYTMNPPDFSFRRVIVEQEGEDAVEAQNMTEIMV